MNRLSRPEIIALTAVLFTFLGSGFAVVKPFPRHTELTGLARRSPIPAALYYPNPAKHVACFLTLNSTEEKGVFAERLNPAEWDLVEMANSDSHGNHGNWFNQACATKIKCDIDVISGHFAGGFFGDLGYTLGFGDLDDHSCSNDCGGILQNPKEVYFFGCNTLADKNLDGRTKEEYYAVLRKDGYSVEAATRVVDDRYSPFGKDNRGKMQRIFYNVPYLYGFTSVSPLGADNQGPLETYFDHVGDYTRHFEAIAASPGNAFTAPNRALHLILPTDRARKTSITQVPGLLLEDPAFKYRGQVCTLFDRKITLSDRSAAAEEILNGDQVLALLPSIETFVYANIRAFKSGSATLLGRLGAIVPAKAILLNAIAQIPPSVTQYEWNRFANVMNWITRPQFEDSIRQLVDSAFSAPVFNSGMRDGICNLNFTDLNSLDFAGILPKIGPRHFANPTAMDSLACLGLQRSPELRGRLDDFLESTAGDFSAIAPAIHFFANGETLDAVTAPDLRLLARFKSVCASTPNVDCAKALSHLGPRDPSVAEFLADEFRRVRLSDQADYAAAFRSMQVGLDLLEGPIFESYTNPGQQDWGQIQAYFYLHPLKSQKHQDRLLALLTDPRGRRRNDEMLYALRNWVPTETELEKTFAAFSARPFAMNSSYVFLGFLHLAANAHAPSTFIDMIFQHARGLSLGSDENVQAFYSTVRLPSVRALIAASPARRRTVCDLAASAKPQFGLDPYGDVVTRKLPLKTCAELAI